MPIYKALLIFLFFLLTYSPCKGDDSGLGEYILSRDGSQKILARALNTDAPFRGCEKTATNLICIKTGIFPNIANNQVARVAVLKNLAIAAKQLLYQNLLEQDSDSGSLNKAIFSDVISGMERRGIAAKAIKGIEFSTFNHNDWCAAVASIKLKNAKNDLKNLYGNTEFINAYCSESLSLVDKLIEDSRYDKAVETLDDLIALNPTDLNIYMAIAEAFLKTNHPDKAENMASKFLLERSEDMSPSQLSRLNDLFNNINSARISR